MWRILRLLIRGYWSTPPYHEHKWEILDSHKIVNGVEKHVGNMYTLQCVRCGEVMSRRCG
jgi:hypothetical protein